GLNLELGECVYRRQQTDFSIRQVIVIDTIENEIVLPFAAAIDMNIATARGRILALRQWHHAGGQCAELDEAASIQRQVIDFLAVDNLSQRGAVGFDQRGRARDFDGLTDIADRHVEVDASNLVNLNGYASAGFGSESR